MDLKNLNEAEAPAAAPPADEKAPNGQPAKEKPAEAPAEKPYEPMIHGESKYDRVTSMLMSVVLGAAMIVGWLALIQYMNPAYAGKPVSKVEIVEVFGGGGGTPEGELGAGGDPNSTPDVQTSGGASNNTAEDTSNFEEPAMQATNAPALDPFTASTGAESEGGEVAAETSTVGGAVATGAPRKFRKGKGGIGRGTGGGPGDGGVPREQRWEFVFPPGQSAEEYERQIDSLGIEIATKGGSNTLLYGSHFSSSPIRRSGLSRADDRFYASWSNQARRVYDVELLKKAGINVEPNALIVQFLPKDLVEKLARLEFDYKGRQPIEIAKTRFKIVSAGGGYTFAVVSQDALHLP